MTIYTADWLLSAEHPPMQNAFIGVDAISGKIQALGYQDELASELPICAHAELITPGLINAHVHLEQSIGRTIQKQAGQSMADWLIVTNQQVGALLSDSDQQQNVIQAGIKECLKFGTTCVNDISRPVTPVMDLLSKAGLRGKVALEYFHPNPTELNLERLDAVVAQYAQLIESYRGESNISVALSPHSLYNVSPKAWQYVVQKIRALDPTCLIHSHMGESLDEMHYFAGQPSAIQKLHQLFVGQSFDWLEVSDAPVSLLDQHKLLVPPLLLVHGVYLTETDRQLMADHKIALAHCPRSNLHLQGETLNWADWQASGVVMALGTDGHLSTPDLDLRAEARAAMAQHDISAETVFNMMTLNGAIAMGLGDVTGSLIVGKAADFVLWQTEKKQLSNTAVYAALLHPETAAQSVYVGGTQVYQASVTVGLMK